MTQQEIKETYSKLTEQGYCDTMENEADNVYLLEKEHMLMSGTKCVIKYAIAVDIKPDVFCSIVFYNNEDTFLCSLEILKFISPSDIEDMAESFYNYSKFNNII